MPPDAFQYIDVVLTWSRAEGGTTAVLRRAEGNAGWTEIVCTAGAEFTAEGMNPERAYAFAAAAVLDDGGLVEEDERETVRVAPLARTRARPPSHPATPSGFAVSQDGANLWFRWDAPTYGESASHEIRAGAT